jgi:hypothetical protein
MLNYLKKGTPLENVLNHFGTPSDKYITKGKTTIVAYFYFPIPEEPVTKDGGIPSGIHLFFTNTLLMEWKEYYSYKTKPK